MESLVAWIKVTQKRRLHVVTVDADRSPELARLLEVRTTPTLLLVADGSVVDRLEGRATGRQIDALVRPHLREDSTMTANDDRLDTEDSGNGHGPEADLEDAPQAEDRQPVSDEEAEQDNYANADDHASS